MWFVAGERLRKDKKKSFVVVETTGSRTRQEKCNKIDWFVGDKKKREKKAPKQQEEEEEEETIQSHS